MHSRKHTCKLASPHELTDKPKACKRASAFLARVTAFQDGFRIAHAQNKFVRGHRLVQIDNDLKIKAK